MIDHGPSMVRTAWSVLGRYGGHEADDVVQEAFIAALTTPALPAGDVGAWLRAITVRKSLDALRVAKRTASHEPVEAADRADGAGSADEALAVREALGRLSAEDRAVLLLVDVEGRSMAETAEALGASNVAVRLRAVRARRRLASLLKGVERGHA